MMPPFQAIILLSLSTTTLGRSIDCNLVCSPLKLAFGEEFRAFPISSPSTFTRGAAFPSSSNPFLHRHHPTLAMTLPCFGQKPSGRVGKGSDFPRLVFKPHLFTLPQPGKCILGPQPCHPLLSSSADAFFLAQVLIKWKEQSPGLLRPASCQSPWWLNLEKGHRRHL